MVNAIDLMVTTAWKNTLRTLEKNKQWDDAIAFMQEVVKQNPNNMDAYIAMNYLLMNLLVEEDYDIKRQPGYAALAQHYFEESYAKFSENPEYSYYTGITAAMSEWFFGISDDNFPSSLTKKALELEPHNPIYQWDYYYFLSRKDPYDKTVLTYIQQVLDENSFIQKTLKTKGAIGEYILGMMMHWAKRIRLQNEEKR